MQSSADDDGSAVSDAGWAGAAAAVYVVGLLLLFGVRSWRHRRATGTTGFNGFDGGDAVARLAGILFAAALIAGLLALLLAAAGITPLLAWGPRHVIGVAGVLVGIGGLALAWVAQGAMGASWRIGVDDGEHTALVTQGVFARVRNPIFTAMMTAQAGSVLMAPTPLGLIALAALVVACELQVRRVEEPYLRATHGPAYRDYEARTGRFLPRLTPSR